MRNSCRPATTAKARRLKILADLDADPARVFAGAATLRGAGAKVVITLHQVVGGLHQHGAEAAVAAAAQGPVGTIDLVAW